MPLAALAGMGSGALHAVSGPDHVLSLVPLSLGTGRRAWRVGLLWGVGHALGTLVFALAMVLVASVLELEVVEHWGERLAGVALAVTGGVGLWRGLAHRSTRPEVPAVEHRAAAAGSIVTIGLVHGATGAAALLLLLPVATAGSALWRWLYLVGFAFGSTVAMAALTAALSASSRALPRPQVLLRHVPTAASLGSMALGAVWALG